MKRERERERERCPRIIIGKEQDIINTAREILREMKDWFS
jgi:hypothetical protein